MKTITQIDQLIKNFENSYGFKCFGAEQGSGTWMSLKLGVISASNASRAMAKKGTDTRDTYMSELIAQIATGVAEEINSKYIDYGREHEGAARANYEIKSNSKITETAFIFKNETFRCGCSPDGIMEAKNHGLELKVPFNAVNYVKFFLDDKIKPDYSWQVQFSMWCADAGSWDFSMYCPLMKVNPLKVKSISRDEEKMKAFDDVIPQLIMDMDEGLAKLGLKFGDQWKRLAVRG